MLVGIDPGVQCGMAAFTDGKLTGLWTCSGLSMLRYLCEAEISQIVMEDSRLQSFVWNATGKTRSPAMKVARSVGGVDKLCSLIEEVAVSRNIKLLSVSPLDKGSKVRAEAFREITGWQGKTNQHERDAAMVAWRYKMLEASA